MYKAMFVLLSLSVVSSYAGGEAAEYVSRLKIMTHQHRTYPLWIRKATEVYIVSKEFVLFARVAVYDKTTVNEINMHLTAKYHIPAGQVFCLSPAYRAWYDFGFGLFVTNDATQLKGGRIKDHMQTYDTNTFWIQYLPAERSTTDDAEDN